MSTMTKEQVEVARKLITCEEWRNWPSDVGILWVSVGETEMLPDLNDPGNGGILLGMIPVDSNIDLWPEEGSVLLVLFPPEDVKPEKVGFRRDALAHAAACALLALWSTK